MENNLEQKLLQALDYQKAGQIEDSITMYRSLVKDYPKNPNLHNYLGAAVFQLGQSKLAIDHIKKAVTIAPNYAEAHFNLAVALESIGQIQPAIRYYLNTLSLSPNFAQAYNNLGVIYYQQGKLNRAIAIYRRAIEIAPDYALTYNNLGNSMRALGNFEEAIDLYQKAIIIQPNYADCHYNLGTTHLLLGNLSEGWFGHEWRNHHRGFVQPLWKGENVGNRKILVYAEQGLGDTIQFFRFIPLLLEKGIRLIFECQRQLFSLLEPLCQGQELLEIIERGQPIPEFDLCVPMMSLPYLLGICELNLIPNKVPYILPTQSSNKLTFDTNSYKVGLVWAGNPKHENDYYRSLPFEQLAPLFSIKTVDFYSLQFGSKTETLIPQSYTNIITDLGGNFRDFRDTASAIGQLDLIISVDTSVSHLAGSMGKDVWTLLPANPDFRWLLERNDSPWYPTMRLFRQSKLGNWPEVISNVKVELRNILQS